MSVRYVIRERTREGENENERKNEREREKERERKRERERDDYRSVSQEIFVLNQEDKERMAALTKKLPLRSVGSSSKPFLEIFSLLQPIYLPFLGP